MTAREGWALNPASNSGPLSPHVPYNKEHGSEVRRMWVQALLPHWPREIGGLHLAAVSLSLLPGPNPNPGHCRLRRLRPSLSSGSSDPQQTIPACDTSKELWGMTGGSWKVGSSQSGDQAVLLLERQTRGMDNEIKSKCSGLLNLIHFIYLFLF